MAKLPVKIIWMLLLLFSVALVGCGGTTTGSSSEYVEGIGLRQQLMPTGPNGLINHVDEDQSVMYNTIPPTSGDHWGKWANCGFYAQGLPDERIVHNLEHGNVVISYNLTASEEVSQLRSTLADIDRYSDWGLARYYDKLPEGQVAVATWGVLDIMDGIDGDRLSRFFDAYSGNLAPEQVPC